MYKTHSNLLKNQYPRKQPIPPPYPSKNYLKNNQNS